MADVVDKNDVRKLVEALNEKADDVRSSYGGQAFGQLGDGGRYLAAKVMETVASMIAIHLLGE